MASRTLPPSRFEVCRNARATRDQVPLMLQALLAERFHLSFHQEIKSMQVYALDVAKGVLKMKESTRSARRDYPLDAIVCEREVARSSRLQTVSHPTSAQQDACPRSRAASRRPVVDASGLACYDFKLE